MAGIVAFSGGPIINRTFRCPSSTNATFLTAFIVSALRVAGWVAVSTITGGQRLQGTSPEGFQAYLDVYTASWAGFGTATFLRFQSSDLTIHGFAHPLQPGTTRTYRIIAGPCQFFISVVGLREDSDFGSCACGGVPYVGHNATPSTGGGQCSDLIQSPSQNEIWWSSGDCWEIHGTNMPTPRTTLGRVGTITGEGFITDATVTNALNSNGIGAPTIFYLLGDDGSLSKPLWYGDTALSIAPLIGWGTTNTDFPVVRGSLWDSYITTAQTPMDTVLTDAGGLTWINYTDQFALGALYLLTHVASLAPRPANTAFIGSYYALTK